VDERPIRFSFPGTLRGFEQGFASLRGALDGGCADPAARYDAEIIFEEIIANIVRHGAPRGGELRIEVAVEFGEDRIVMTFEDDGIPFDPRTHADSVPPASLAEASGRGLGLILVHRAAGTIQYLRTPAQRNRLTMTVRCAPRPTTARA
jgi:anti-sigma regulatory factor (Ser/Thr protein kinase)